MGVLGTSVYDSKVSDVLIDTFYRPLLLTNSSFDKFVTYLNTTYSTNVTCNTTDGHCFFLGKCSTRMASFKDIVIQLGNTDGISIPASSYLIDKSTDTGAEGCLIGVQRSTNNTYVLG